MKKIEITEIKNLWNQKIFVTKVEPKKVTNSGIQLVAAKEPKENLSLCVIEMCNETYIHPEWKKEIPSPIKVGDMVLVNTHSLGRTCINKRTMIETENGQEEADKSVFVCVVSSIWGIIKQTQEEIDVDGLPKYVNEVIPTDDRILVKRDAPVEKTEGGIYIPDALQEPAQMGEILRVGSGYYDRDGHHDLVLKPGDKVVFSKYTGTSITEKDKLTVLMRESDIFATLLDPTIPTTVDIKDPDFDD